MTWERVKHNLMNYNYLCNALKELEKSLETLEESEIDMFSTEYTSREEKIYNKVEDVEKRLITIQQGIEKADLTERQEIALEFVLMGKSMRWVGKNIFNNSRTTVRREINAASKKIAEAINTFK